MTVQGNQQQKQRNMASEGHPVGTTEFGKGSPAGDGWHDAVCAEIVDLGMDYQYSKKGEHRGALVFQLDEEFEDGNFAGQRKEGVVYFSYDQGLGSPEKGTKLRAFLESWMGRAFTREEMEGFKTTPFQLAKLLLKPLRLFTVAEKAKTSDKMQTKVLKAEKAGANKLHVENYTPWHQRGKDRGQQQQGGGRQQPQQQNEREPWEEGDDDAEPTAEAEFESHETPRDDDAPW